jgi:hypothetical protein
VVTVVGWWEVVDDGLTTASDTAPALLTWLALGLIALAITGERRRPGDLLWRLAAVMALTTPLAFFSALSTPSLAALGAFTWFACALVPAHLLLVYPDGLRAHRRAALVSCWLVPLLLAVLTVAVSGPRRSTGFVTGAGVRALFWIYDVPNEDYYIRQGNPFLISASSTWTRVVWLLWSIWVVIVVLTVAMVLWRRLRAADPATRRLAWAVYAAGLLWCAAQLTQPLLAFPGKLPLPALGSDFQSVLIDRWYSDVVQLASPISVIVLAGALGWAQLVRPRLARAAGGAVRLDVGGKASAERLQRSLATTLDDPTVRVVFAMPLGWVDESGATTSPAASPDRAAIVLRRGDEIVAAIEHDVSLLAQPELIEMAATMVGLALDNERLHMETLARVEETRASGARLLAAADQARSDFEVRVVRGPEATLAQLSTLLATATPSPEVLSEVHRGLRAAVVQVRSIAHGLCPPALLEEGLRAGFDDLSSRIDTPLHVRGLPSQRFPPAIELTCYLAVVDAATRAGGPLTVELSADDALTCRIDGAVGAPDARVVDRTEAVGGTMDVQAGCLLVTLPLPEVVVVP